MIIPIGTDVRLRSQPLGNYILIGLNVAVFLLEGIRGEAQTANWIDGILPPLDAAVPTLREYLTYQFRHGGVMHLLGNMLFLWIFGNAVCDRLGSLSYTMLYLAGGVFAGLVFASTAQARLVGASGAIAAVTTAFLVLYPRVHITVLLWAFVVMTLQIPAMFLIVFKIILWDNIIAPGLDRGMTSNVAFSAHLGGYLFGFAVTWVLLALRALPRNQFDMLALWSRYQRRAGLTPAPPPLPGTRRARPITQVQERSDDPLPSGPQDAMRNAVLDRLSESDFEEAAQLYEQLLETAPDGAVLPRSAHLDLANYLAQNGRHKQAAAAYDTFLRAYPNAAEYGTVQLYLGLLWRRYLNDNQQARTHLELALRGLRDPQHRALAESELDALGGGTSTPPS